MGVFFIEILYLNPDTEKKMLRRCVQVNLLSAKPQMVGFLRPPSQGLT